MIRRRPGWLMLLGLVWTLLLGPALGAQPVAQGKIKALQVKLKVQSITKDNFYMGDIWVANPKFTDAQTGERYVGYARAVGLDALGNQVDLGAAWQPSDPAMVTVNPNTGHMVKITVLKPGQSSVTVSADGISKKLVIQAAFTEGVMHVEISQ